LTQGDERPVAVDVVELLDGWLVSLFHYAGPEYNGFAKLVPHVQEIFYIDAGGTASKVGEREIRGHTITLGDAPFVPQAAWWLSPALYTFARWPGSVLDTGLARPQRLAAVPQVRMFYPLAAGLMLLSLGLGGWWLRGARAGTRRGLWLAMCGLLGLPAFLSLVCLVPRAPRSGG
jgi:hypothetical protein